MAVTVLTLELQAMVAVGVAAVQPLLVLLVREQLAVLVVQDLTFLRSLVVHQHSYAQVVAVVVEPVVQQALLVLALVRLAMPMVEQQQVLVQVEAVLVQQAQILVVLAVLVLSISVEE
jgi:hypothetical protein